MRKDKKYAVLIDSDNIAPKYLNIIFDEISKEGIATYKRIYGDWTQNSSKWKTELLNNSIIPIQQYSYTKGKNSTDSAMIIDSMDILYSGNVDGFCLVSSDSDFTRLAARLREAGKNVIGMGETKTPKPFISACNQFKYLDKLFQNNELEEAEKSKAEEIQQRTNIELDNSELKTIKKAIRTIINEESDEEGWIFAGHLGSLLVKRFPDFDVRNFGYSKMTQFLESLNTVEITKIPQERTGVLMVYAKNKSKRRYKK